MKTYILRPSTPVEPQKSIRSPRPKPTAPVSTKGPVLFIGLDVHNDSITVIHLDFKLVEEGRVTQKTNPVAFWRVLARFDVFVMPFWGAPGG